MSNVAWTGMQASTNANSFMNLTTPIFMPSLSSSSGMDSPFLPRPHGSQAPETIGFTDLQADRQGVDMGGVSYFRYTNNDNDVLKSVTLCAQLSALAPGTGGLQPRYVDDICSALLQKIEFYYGGELLQTLYGDEIHYRQMQELPHDELTRRYQLQAAGLSEMERALLAQNDQYVYFEIPFWWTKNPQSAWHQYAFQRLTRIVFYFRNATYLVQQNGGTSIPVPGTNQGTTNPVSVLATPGGLYLKNHFLRFEVTCPSLSTKQAYQSMVSAMGESGWPYMIQDFQRIIDISIAQGTSARWQYILNTFTKYGYNLRFWFRPANNLLPNYLNNYRWITCDVPAMSFDVSGLRYLQPLDSYYIKHAEIGKYFLGNEQFPIYNIFLNDYPDVSSYGMGGMEFSNTVNPQINIDFNTTYPVTPVNGIIADFYLECHNYVRLVLDGAKSAAQTIQPINS